MFKQNKITVQKDFERKHHDQIINGNERLKHLFETDTLNKLYKGLDKESQKKTKDLIRQMTLKIEEMQINGEDFNDDDKLILSQFNSLKLNLESANNDEF